MSTRFYEPLPHFTGLGHTSSTCVRANNKVFWANLYNSDCLVAAKGSLRPFHPNGCTCPISWLFSHILISPCPHHLKKKNNLNYCHYKRILISVLPTITFSATIPLTEQYNKCHITPSWLWRFLWSIPHPYPCPFPPSSIPFPPNPVCRCGKYALVLSRFSGLFTKPLPINKL